jgi:hypothetical protein
VRLLLGRLAQAGWSLAKGRRCCSGVRLQPLGRLCLRGRGALVSKRAAGAAQVRGLLWRQYTRNEALIDTMMKLEQRVDEGRLKMKEEVGGRSGVLQLHLQACVEAGWLPALASAAVPAIRSPGEPCWCSDAAAAAAAAISTPGPGPRPPLRCLPPLQALLLDVHLKDQVISVLMSYNPFWLRLGLELVVGKAITGNGERCSCQPGAAACVQRLPLSCPSAAPRRDGGAADDDALAAHDPAGQQLSATADGSGWLDQLQHFIKATFLHDEELAQEYGSSKHEYWVRRGQCWRVGAMDAAGVWAPRQSPVQHQRQSRAMP